MIDDLHRLLLKTPTMPPLPGAQSIRCSTCNESLTVCKGAHGKPTSTAQPTSGYVPGSYSTHDGQCQRPNGGACDCKTRDPFAI